MRALDRAADVGNLAVLWERALGSTWPVDARRLCQIADAGLVIDGDNGLDGAALLSGSALVALVVDPRVQRTGIGRSLVEATSPASIGSGGSGYLWPGVPDNLDAARAFFSAIGWEDDYQAWDHIVHLAGYEAPLPAPGGLSFGAATAHDHRGVVVFNEDHFPQWARYFRDLPPECTYVARDTNGDIVGTLLLEWSGAGDPGPWTALLGNDYGTLGAVGVIPSMQGKGIGSALVVGGLTSMRDRGVRTCHIGWLVRSSFYQRCGSTPWRSYTVQRRRDPAAGEASTTP